jgi:hypothetical protein
MLLDRPVLVDDPVDGQCVQLRADRQRHVRDAGQARGDVLAAAAAYHAAQTVLDPLRLARRGSTLPELDGPESVNWLRGQILRRSPGGCTRDVAQRLIGEPVPALS